jgi:hypothetical protein
VASKFTRTRGSVALFVKIELALVSGILPKALLILITSSGCGEEGGTYFGLLSALDRTVKSVSVLDK